MWNVLLRLKISLTVKYHTSYLLEPLRICPTVRDWIHLEAYYETKSTLVRIYAILSQDALYFPWISFLWSYSPWNSPESTQFWARTPCISPEFRAWFMLRGYQLIHPDTTPRLWWCWVHAKNEFNYEWCVRYWENRAWWRWQIVSTRWLAAMPLSWTNTCCWSSSVLWLPRYGV